MRQRQRTHPRLRVFIERSGHGRAAKRSTLELGPPDPHCHFTPQRHGLSPELCRVANTLLRKADLERPLHGSPQQVRFRRACRIGGILRAVRRRRVGNARFGHHLMGYRGGRVMQRHGLHILRTIAPIGHLAARLAHERRQAAAYYETTGEPLALGANPKETPEQARVRSLQEQWEAEQWQTQHDRLSW